MTQYGLIRSNTHEYAHVTHVSLFRVLGVFVDYFFDHCMARIGTNILNACQSSPFSVWLRSFWQLLSKYGPSVNIDADDAANVWKCQMSSRLVKVVLKYNCWLLPWKIWSSTVIWYLNPSALCDIPIVSSEAQVWSVPKLCNLHFVARTKKSHRNINGSFFAHGWVLLGSMVSVYWLVVWNSHLAQTYQVFGRSLPTGSVCPQLPRHV